MTVSVEFAPVTPVVHPVVTRPVATRPAREAVRRGAGVTRRPVGAPRPRVVAGGASCAPAPQPIAASSAVQLTRRGWTVLLSLAVGVAAVLVWIAYLSHPAAPVAAAPAPTSVVVQSGDTLWSIASRVAPNRDPRAVVYDLQQANGIEGSTVVAGQVLRLR